MHKRICCCLLAACMLFATACKDGESSHSEKETKQSSNTAESTSQTTSKTETTTTSQTTTTERTTSSSASSQTKKTTASSAYDPDGQRKKYIADGVTKDTDKDGLPDDAEKLIGTDPKKPDSDGDSLTDYQEYCLTGTDPLRFDSIQNGISDAKVDLDNDGLSNESEIKLKTDPKNPDTDHDGLSDGDEVNRYKTDPLKADTDGDGISDGDEVKAGSDPLSKGKKTSGYSEQPIPASSDAFKAVNKDTSPFTLSMKVFASADAQSKLKARETTITDLKSSKVLIGSAVDIVADASLDCRGATLYFRMDKEYVKTKLTFGKSDRDGIKALYVAYFDKQANALLPLETSYDEDSGTISAQFTGELTTFMLVDSNLWSESMMKSWAASRKDMPDLMKLTI